MSLGEYISAGAGTTKLLLHLNNNSTDSSGNSNNGTDTNITYVDSKFGKCASFNGSSSKIERTDYLGLSVGGNNITVSMWFNSSVLPSDGSSQALFFIAIDPPSGTRYFYRFYITNTAGIYSINGLGRGSYNFSPSTGQWYNLIFTSTTSNNNLIYLNGVLVSSNTATDSASATNYPRTVIGATSYTNGDFEYFNGLIDEVIIENRVWSAQEVAKYYTYAKGYFATL